MKICLDAGHYGKYNQSPANKTYWESDFSWKFHLLLKAELEAYGITVVTTRAEQSKDLGLEARGRKAAGCDLFLSLHSNAIGSGVSSTDYPLACCCVAGTADILGLDLAETVQRTMQTVQKARIIKKKGSGGDWYGVLRGAASVGVPGILLEHSFHTNARATEWLLNDDNLRRMAQEEARVIAEAYHIKPAEPEPQNTAKVLPYIAKMSASECQIYLNWCANKGAGNYPDSAEGFDKFLRDTYGDRIKSK